MAIGALALALLVGPWALRTWQENHLTQGKAKVLELASTKPSIDLALCLMKHEPGGLALAISSENHFTDPARGLVVEIAAKGSQRDVTAWLPQGVILQPGESAQLANCTAGQQEAPHPRSS
jgi:hypothetical protein